MVSPSLPLRPLVHDNHRSSVVGITLLGDLVDAPVIKAAFSQGYSEGLSLARRLPQQKPETGWEVIVVGAGPAGAAAAVALHQHGRRVLLVEQTQPFSTIDNFPAGKMIYAEPAETTLPPGLWFDDAPKEQLVARWREWLTASGVPLALGETLEGSRSLAGGHRIQTRDHEGTVRERTTHHLILALGRRGQPRRLDIPGAHLPLVKDRQSLDLPHEGPVLVVGGGDSAIETALNLAERGLTPTISYRQTQFFRIKPKNQERIQQAKADGRIALALGSQPVCIQPDSVTLSLAEGGQRELPVVAVIPELGADPPIGLLRRMGIRMEGERGLLARIAVGAFALLTLLFYILKQKQTFWPFSDGGPLGGLHDLLKVDLGFRTVDGSFWGTVLYSVLITGFGLRAMVRHTAPAQRKRYLSLITFQLLFLFGIPELIAPLFLERPWKVYALTVPWPLSLWSLIDAPSWAGGSTGTALAWLGGGALVTFLALPLYIRHQGERFCSYLCGCGGLAETLGDVWRSLAPRGELAVRTEWAGRLVLGAAIPVTLLILLDAWGVLHHALAGTKDFAQTWYGFVVDFGLASVVGVALYPLLGNRVWCRYFCPLRAGMEVVARKTAKLQILDDGRCIGCGECSRACQMGIDVQRFAQTSTPLHNGNSACIQCGICIEVCPMSVLRIESNRTDFPQRFSLAPPRPPWEH